jgi:hypothetical protein
VTDLARLQRQFYDRVTAGVPSDDLAASGDLEIYARMYASRLRDALADDYPKLHRALGNQPFEALADDYLRAHPPRSFTLREAGALVAEHLRHGHGHGRPAPPWAADLAALERARLEVFDGPDAEPLTQAEVVAQGSQLPELVLRWVPSSIVVPIEWAIDELWTAIEDDQDPLDPARASRTVLVWRRDISVLHRTLDPDEAQLAPAIGRGVSFAEVCEVLGTIHGDNAGPRAAELLLRWLDAEAVIGGRAPSEARDGNQ